jgi:hypothetical protein
MRKNLFFVLIFCLVIFATGSLSAQSRKNDIPVNQVPENVLQILQDYAKVLSAETLEKCAESFVQIAGGGLVNESGSKLRQDVPQFSLKKDYNNFKFYAQPLQITRVNKSWSNGDGYGGSAIKGWVYKIWIDKKKGVNGMPAPVSIMVPEEHPSIKTPKVIGIGSF